MFDEIISFFISFFALHLLIILPVFFIVIIAYIIVFLMDRRLLKPDGAIASILGLLFGSIISLVFILF
ncbi:hypothetical protein D7X33_22340 [Butyricicoccus sp. 1XD8-22]|nr:hypothetical protein D7X33_22340 [Butyricicoccus sp. 1XD8-22]